MKFIESESEFIRSLNLYCLCQCFSWLLSDGRHGFPGSFTFVSFCFLATQLYTGYGRFVVSFYTPKVGIGVVFFWFTPRPWKSEWSDVLPQGCGSDTTTNFLDLMSRDDRSLLWGTWRHSHICDLGPESMGEVSLFHEEDEGRPHHSFL